MNRSTFITLMAYLAGATMMLVAYFQDGVTRILLTFLAFILVVSRFDVKPYKGKISGKVLKLNKKLMKHDSREMHEN